jgi:Zn-dependent protease with chaperone function
LVLGCTFEESEAKGYSGNWSVAGRCDEAVLSQTQGDWLVSKTLNLTPLLQKLPSVELGELGLVLSLPQLGFTEILPALKTQAGGSFPFWGRQSSLYYRQSFRAEQVVQPIAIEFGFRFGDLLLRGMSIPVAILLPMAVMLGLRRRALRFSKGEASPTQAVDPAPVWFGYLRTLNLVGVVLWVVWSVVHIAAGLGDVLTFVLGEGVTVGILRDLIFFTPPALAIIGCFVLSHPVFVKLGGSELTRMDLLRQAFWEQVNVVLPLMALFSGINALFRGETTTGMVGIVAAQVIALVLAPIVMKARGLTTQAITTGDLRDRIFSLAQVAGVKLQQVYVVPMGRSKMANAFAVQGGNVLLTDYLLKNMSRREVDAVMAHELAHFQLGHHRGRFSLILVMVFATFVAAWVAPIWVPGINLLIAPAAIIVTLVVLFSGSRQNEYQADAQAAVLTQDPAAMITALVKLSRLNVMPLQWRKSQEWLSTHPSMQRRIEAIARRHSLSDAELDGLVNGIDDGMECYALPEAIVSDQLVFSTSFKQKRLMRLGWILLLVPVLMACVVAYGALQLRHPWIFGVGSVGFVGLLLVMANYVPLVSCGGLQSAFRKKMRQQGWPIETGMLVGLAPDGALRTYEGFLVWDCGYLWLVCASFCSGCVYLFEKG